LVIQYIAYRELKLKDLELSIKKIIDLNYPDNKLALNVNEGTKSWWKFWESLAD
jgi:outer membrane protein assembly factor BamD